MGVLSWVWQQVVDLVKTVVKFTLISAFILGLLATYVEYRTELNAWFNEHVISNMFDVDVQGPPEDTTGPPPTAYTKHRLKGPDPPLTYKVPVNLDDTCQCFNLEHPPPGSFGTEVMLL